MIQKSHHTMLPIYLLAFLSLVFGCVSTADAATVLITTGAHDVGVGQEFDVSLFVDTEGETINAIGGRLVFPDTVLALESISDGDSLISVWVQHPKADGTGAIVFSGITPGGFQVAHGKIFSATFKTKKAGDGTLTLKDVVTYLNDGNGTEAVVQVSPLSLSVSENTTVSPFVRANDIDPPESFTPEIGRDPSIFDGKWFVAFTTQDKASGIQYYEVHENGTWVRAESPYVLQDQSLQEDIEVKAVDNAGNEKVVRVPARHPRTRATMLALLSLLGVGILIIGIKVLKGRRRNRT